MSFTDFDLKLTTTKKSLFFRPNKYRVQCYASMQVTMKVKRDIGKTIFQAILHDLLFFTYNKKSTARL